jgi:hypothetical protein
MNKILKCKKCNEEDEDNSLMLIVKQTVRDQYKIKDDGSIEFYDNLSVDQEMFLECQVCGAKYEFNNDDIMIVDSKKLVTENNCNCSFKNIHKSQLSFKELK